MSQSWSQTLGQLHTQYFTDKINYARLLAPLLFSIIVMTPCADPTYQENVISRQAMSGIWFTVLTGLGLLWTRSHTVADVSMKRWIDIFNVALVFGFCMWAILYRCMNNKTSAFGFTMFSFAMSLALLVTYLRVDFVTSLCMSFIVAWMVLVLINSYEDAQIPAYGWN